MDKYLQYDYNDFTQEPSFVNWVRTSNKEDELFWNKWIEKNPEKNEEVEKARKVVSQLVFKEPKTEKALEDKIWSKIAAETQGAKVVNMPPNKNKESGGVIRKLMVFTAVAASLIAVMFVYLGSDFDTNISTQLAETKTVNLPDGSVIEINASSEIAYDKDSWNENRIVEMEGEAFFSVEKGSKFEVKTPTGTVTVLGTSFNIFARDKELNVYCATGKVAVASSTEQTILTPNESVAVINDKHNKKSQVAKKQNRSNWRQAMYAYEGATLSKVVEDLERQFDIEVLLDAKLQASKYTGSFMGKNKEKALSEVFWPLDLKYEMDGRNVKITK